MKKYLIIMLVLVNSNLFSLDNGLITGFKLEYNIIDNMFINNHIASNKENSFNISLITGYRFKNLRIIGIYTNTFKMISLDNYNPIQDKFHIDIKYSIKNIDIGFSHWCDHPVTTMRDKRLNYIDSAKRSFYLNFYKEY